MFGCIFLPQFQLQAAFRWQDVRGPAVVVNETTLKGIVAETSEEAAAQGIVAGMTSAQALARVRGLVIRSRSCSGTMFKPNPRANGSGALPGCGTLLRWGMHR